MKTWIVAASVLGAVFVVVGLTVISLMSAGSGWCSEKLEAGDCRKYDFDGNCYCIDENHSNLTQGQLGIFEHAQEQCQKLKGRLAAPEQNDLLKWLAKQMHKTKVKTAIIALEKVESYWFWVKDKIDPAPYSLPWRIKSEENDQNTRAMITIEPVKDEETGKELDYDHYKYTDTSYQWYGYKTYDNSYDEKEGLNYICVYKESPSAKKD